MNIKKAKEQIINTVKAYLAKDELGRYMIPQHKQRPVFLMGPPGIGKTEIMSQIASELGIGLLSYSMTHHTRQSALGLPVIKKNEYKGNVFDVSEYTMSEILASVYSLMKKSGVENGILFLDEINCISETLMPIMLQFLQYKVFGGHKLPEGWIVVTAGNPPEYNNSVREFDIVTMDRMKLIEASPDLNVWKEYAYSGGIHGAVLTYLEIKPQNFYKIESAAGGKRFVTARGWDDLSRILTVYERLGIKPVKELMQQYIHNDTIADDFAIYYELYDKYKSDYKVSQILSGDADSEIKTRAAEARFDERYSLLGLLLEALNSEVRTVLDRDELLTELKTAVSESKEHMDAVSFFAGKAEECRKERERLSESGGLSPKREEMLISMTTAYESMRSAGDPSAMFMSEVGSFKRLVSAAKEHFSNMFAFCEDVFGSGQEILILVTELAAAPLTARFISAYGCPEYHKYDKELMFYERRIELINEIEKVSDSEVPPEKQGTTGNN